MKLTGELKERVSKAETKEEKKGIIAEAGMELTDEEMDNVVGGGLIFPKRGKSKSTVPDDKNNKNEASGIMVEA